MQTDRVDGPSSGITPSQMLANMKGIHPKLVVIVCGIIWLVTLAWSRERSPKDLNLTAFWDTSRVPLIFSSLSLMKATEERKKRGKIIITQKQTEGETRRTYQYCFISIE